MRIQCEDLDFDFTDALQVSVFDVQDPAHAAFHGLSHAMKAVDLVVELQDCHLFIEIKDFRRLAKPASNDLFNQLKLSLKYKFRDSFVYRWAENMPTKPIHYLCLIELDDALSLRLEKDLKRELPCGRPIVRWQREVAVSCVVLNFEAWKRSFPKWPVSRQAAK